MDFSKRLNYRSNSIITTIIIILIIILLNYLSTLHFFRMDLTEDKSYTVSEVSKTMLSELDDFVTIKVFFSKKLPPQFENLTREVKDILNEYEAFSNGNIKLKYLNPADDEKIRSEANSLGIPEIEMNVYREDKVEIQKGFLGIGVFYGGKQEILPIVQNLQNLEYDITSAIKKVSAETTKTIGFLKGHGEHSIKENTYNPAESGDYTFVKNLLKKNYELKTVDISDGKPIENIDTLVIAGPKESFSKRDIYEIDQFIMNGGEIIFLLDAVTVSNSLQATSNKLDLDDLLNGFGVKLKNSLVYDQSHEMASFQKGFFSIVQPYPLWPKLIGRYFNKENPIISKIESIVLLWASPFEVNEKKDINHEILATTTNRSGTLKSQNGVFNLDPGQNFKVDGGEKESPVIVFVKGKFKSLFAEQGIPPLKEKEKETGSEDAELILDAKDPYINRETKKETTEEGRLLFVGDSNFIADGFARRFQNNFHFFLNAVDYFTIDEDLIHIRSKQITERPLIKTESVQKSVNKALGIFLIPALIIVIAIIKSLMRKKRKLKYMALVK